MTLPSFLIVGGMKCGSTTLYRDLANSPTVFFPLDKEPENLTSDDVLTDSGRAEYELMFKKARPDQLCAEASTAYTKQPTFERVPQRAFELIGPDLKVIYIIRKPIERMVSHLHHCISSGIWEPCDLKSAIGAYPELIQYSEYGKQIAPWIERFGPDQVRIVRFDDYMSNRRARCVELWNWLGAEPCPQLIDEEKAFNASKSKPILRGPLRWVPNNPVYRSCVRPLFSNQMRGRIRSVVLPKARVERPALENEVYQFAQKQLLPDIERLKQLEQICFLGPVQDWSAWEKTYDDAQVNHADRIVT